MTTIRNFFRYGIILWLFGILIACDGGTKSPTESSQNTLNGIAIESVETYTHKYCYIRVRIRNTTGEGRGGALWYNAFDAKETVIASVRVGFVVPANSVSTLDGYAWVTPNNEYLEGCSSIASFKLDTSKSYAN